MDREPVETRILVDGRPLVPALLTRGPAHPPARAGFPGAAPESPGARAAALRRLAEEDPKTCGRVSVGSRERAEELGFPWPPDAD
ncbi:hypothetical protein OG562_14645 [Streptomyces sp. NBC_01275]|uniref:hypothetical protein n=1 Tax=Streptomyces sp. NBC_01275 TaxID=2903807 RepID=UPI00225B90E5|nr:hypothetical protein [Streptomyces sp. NBC_01275]MCX4762191.1 hypothetical protein [Streptomyces sp. NBC_01275]